jgi:hypothetical protein
VRIHRLVDAAVDRLGGGKQWVRRWRAASPRQPWWRRQGHRQAVGDPHPGRVVNDEQNRLIKDREMKLTIIAATGGIGRQLLQQAIAAGHDVTAVVRDPGKLSGDVRVVTADLAAPDPAALESAVDGADAVLSGLGPRSKAEVGIASRGTRAIVRAMQARAYDASSLSAPRRWGPCPHPTVPSHPSTIRATGSSCGTYSLRC